METDRQNNLYESVKYTGKAITEANYYTFVMILTVALQTVIFVLGITLGLTHLIFPIWVGLAIVALLIHLNSPQKRKISVGLQRMIFSPVYVPLKVFKQMKTVL